MDSNFERRERLFKSWERNKSNLRWNRKRSSHYLGISGHVAYITNEDKKAIVQQLSELGYISGSANKADKR